MLASGALVRASGHIVHSLLFTRERRQLSHLVRNPSFLVQFLWPIGIVLLALLISVIVNATVLRRLEAATALKLPPDSDLELVEQVTLEVAAMVMQSVPGGLPDFVPFVRFSTFTTYGIKAVIVMMGNEYRDQFLIKHECIKRLMRRYRQEGIELARPMGVLLGNEVAHDLSLARKEDAAEPLE